jgi:hypothetical protein
MKEDIPREHRNQACGLSGNGRADKETRDARRSAGEKLNRDDTQRPNTMNQIMAEQRTQAEPGRAGGASPIIAGTRDSHSVVNYLCGAVALGILALAPSRASATLIYAWHTTTGPTLSASFRVPDSAILDGTVTAAEIAAGSGFTASTPAAGTFVSLTADSGLGVDPTSGTVLSSTYSLTATNSSDVLQLGSTGFFIPTTRPQAQGRGLWNVTHLLDSAPLQISFVGFTNGLSQLRVTAGTNATFEVEASSDLAQWTPILTNVIINGTTTVTDPEPAVLAARFYRAVIRN